MPELFAGAGRCPIDPTRDMYPMPTRFDITEDLYDSCYCRAIAIKSGDTKLLMLIFELSDYPTVPELLNKVAEATGFPKENILLSYTHNHTSPCDEANLAYGRAPDSDEAAQKREKYKVIELEASLQAAKQAVAAMRPAKCGFGTIDSYVNVNRDYETMHGFWVEAPNYAGYSDKTLSIVKFIAEDGKLIAALLNHGTHSTCALHQKDFDQKTKTSGNFSGIACKFVEKHFGDDAVVAWTSGAAGNQDPLMSHGFQYEYPDGYTTTVPYPDGMDYMQMEFLGRRHGADAVKCIHSIKEYTDEFSICNLHKTAMLPRQKRVAPKDGKFINPRMGGNGLRDEEKFAYGQVPEVPNLDSIVTLDEGNPVEMHIHLVVLGDTALILTNGELYAELGRAIKDVSPYKNTVVLTYSIAASTSYIVDKSSVHHKVFQAFGPVAPGKSDDVIIDTVNELFKDAMKSS